MRPTGVVLIGLYYLMSALFLVLLAIFLLVGGSVLGAMFGDVHGSPVGWLGVGLMVGMLGGAIFFFYAVLAAIAAYGIWSMREWGRILAIVLAAVSLLFSFPGLLFMGLHLHLFFGSYRLLRIAADILIIWYLMQPQTKAIFLRTASATPGS